MGRQGDGSRNSRGVSNQIWETRGRFLEEVPAENAGKASRMRQRSPKGLERLLGLSCKGARASGRLTQDEAEVRPSRRHSLGRDTDSR